MAKNINWIVVIVVAIVVGVLTAIITANITGNVLFNNNNPTIINANECRADGICEFNEASGERVRTDYFLMENEGDDGGFSVSYDRDGDSQADTSLAVKPQFITLVTHGMMNFILKDSPDSFFKTAYFMKYERENGSDLFIQMINRTSSGVGFVNTFYQDVHFNQPIILDSLNGNGTAYLCVDNAGKVFRSLTACR